MRLYFSCYDAWKNSGDIKSPRTKAEPSVSGSGLERRRSEVSEFSPIGGSEGYGTCADDRMAKGHCEFPNSQ